MSGRGRKRRGEPTARERLMIFFLTSPGEYLTIEDAAAKFERSPDTVRSAIESGVEAGLFSWCGFKGRAFRVGIGPRLVELAGPVFKEKFGSNPFVDTRA